MVSQPHYRPPSLGLITFEVPEDLVHQVVQFFEEKGVHISPQRVSQIRSNELPIPTLLLLPSHYFSSLLSSEPYLLCWLQQNNGYFQTLSKNPSSLTETCPHLFTSSPHIPSLEELCAIYHYIEQAPFGMTLVNSNNEILYVNPYEAHIHGYSPSELKGKKVTIFAPENGNLLTPPKELSERHPWIRKTLNRHKNGQLFLIFLISSPIFDENDNYVGRITISQKPRELEKVVLQGREVDILDQLVFTFSMLRHEIGNSLNSIQGIAYFLAKYGPDIEREKVSEFGDKLLSACRQIEYLLNQLKQLSLFDHLNLLTLDFGRLLQDIIQEYSYSLTDTNIELEVEVPQEKLYAQLDPQAFRHVLFNLLNNARDAVKDVEQPKISIHCWKDEEQQQIRLDVSDNGCGIPKQDLENIFKPFFTTKDKGTGLGLVLAKKILSSLQGSIDISSTFGEGTTIHLALPLAEPPIEEKLKEMREKD